MPRLRSLRAVLALAAALFLAAACRSGSPPAATSSTPASPAAQAASSPSAPVEMPAQYDEDRWYVAPVTAQGETLLFYTDCRLPERRGRLRKALRS